LTRKKKLLLSEKVQSSKINGISFWSNNYIKTSQRQILSMRYSGTALVRMNICNKYTAASPARGFSQQEFRKHVTGLRSRQKYFSGIISAL